jgi:hypothetical protein
MCALDFRQVLERVNESSMKGVDSLDSQHLAALLDSDTVRASQYLSRLHAMGFLTRRKQKRVCISKNGKQCVKGYYYDYSVSSQGRKYLQWMREGRPLQQAMYLQMMSRMPPFLTDEDKEKLPYFASYALEQMRYRGPSRAVQDFGFLMGAALPMLTGKLGEMSKRIYLLEFQCDRLEGIVKDQAAQISALVEKMADLLTQQRRRTEESQKLLIDLARRLIRSYEENEIISHISDACRILNKAHEGMILDLGELLATRNLEAAGKLLDSGARRHSAEMSLAKEYVDKAERELRELQEKSNT